MSIRRKSIRGQAIAELLIAMVGLAVAMAAVLQVCLAGNSNIRNLYESRRDAESKARRATFDMGGTVCRDNHNDLRRSEKPLRRLRWQKLLR